MTNRVWYSKENILMNYSLYIRFYKFMVPDRVSQK